MNRIQSLNEAVTGLSIIEKNIADIRATVAAMDTTSVYKEDVYRAVDVVGVALLIARELAVGNIDKAHAHIVKVEKLVKMQI